MEEERRDAAGEQPGHLVGRDRHRLGAERRHHRAQVGEVAHPAEADVVGVAGQRLQPLLEPRLGDLGKRRRDRGEDGGVVVAQVVLRPHR